MKTNFFTVLQEGDSDKVSSRRVITFALLILWTFGYFYNIFTGKSPSETYSTQLYLMLTTGMGIIFGSGIADTIAKVKIKQSDNNAAIGAASPQQPAAAPVAPAQPPAVVINP
jgi:hypothetical protein